MTNNRKIANSVLAELKRNKLIPYNISFGNGYFIFDMGEDAVVWFNIKGVKGWRFAMWIDTTSDEEAIQFFTQYEEFIDKFKPSRSTFVENVSRASLVDIAKADTKEKRQDEIEWAYRDIVKMVQHIKYNPKLAYVQEGRYSNYITDRLWKVYLKEKKDMYANRIYKVKEHIREDIIPYTINNISAKVVKQIEKDIVSDITVSDNNTKLFTVSPRWCVKTYFKRISNKDEECFESIDHYIDRVNKFGKLFNFTRTNTEFIDYLDDGYGNFKVLR